MKRAYLVRWGAYGDHIHMSNVIRALHEDGYEITFEYNYKGAQIHSYNPRISRHIVFEPMAEENGGKLNYKLDEYKRLKDEYDIFVNFSFSLEEALIEPEHKPSYFWPLWKRRLKNTNICFYDQSMIWAGLTAKKYMGLTGDIFFKREEHEHVLNQLRPYEDKFIVLLALRGSTYQKHLRHVARGICDEWLKRHPDSVIITTGDKSCQGWEWPSAHGTTIAPERGLGDGTHSLVHKSARMPFRQALNIAKYADLVITPETGLGIGAGAFATPKIMLLTTSNILNIAGNDRNDYSLQSEAYCSPCARAIYNTDNCPVDDSTKLPICIMFDRERVVRRMEEVFYNKHQRYWEIKDEGVY